MEDKLQLDRVRLLQGGKTWKKERVKLHGNDETNKNLTERLRNKEKKLATRLDPWEIWDLRLEINFFDRF